MNYGQKQPLVKTTTNGNGHVGILPRSRCRKLDIACGGNKQKGFTGIDILKNTKADFHFDLESYPWPIESNCVEEIYCSHYLEHVEDAIAFMDEVFRILKPGGFVKFVCPYYTSIRAWQDPTHKRVISEAFFHYFDADWRKFANVDHYPIKSAFKIEKIDHALSPEYVGKSNDAIQFAAMHYWNVINDIQVIMRKPK